VPPALVAIDCDGTLVGSDGAVSVRNRAALGLLRERGVPIVIATGRPWLVVERTIAEIGGADFAICSNGAMTVRVADGAVVRNVFLPLGLPERAVPAIRAALPGTGFALEFERGAKSEPGWDRRLPPGVPLGPPVDDVLVLISERGPVRKIIAFHDRYDRDTSSLAELVQAVVGQEAQVEHSGLAFIEVGVPGVDKAVALAEVCAALGVAQAATLAFGDDVNDRQLLAWAGVGVAMANAKPAAVAAADVVTTSNDDDGVAVYLEEAFAR
jgi:hypothetical protein